MDDEQEKDTNLVEILPPVANGQEPALPIANHQLFEIDDDNFVYNGEALFHLSDVKSMIKTFAQPPRKESVILFGFIGSQVGIPIARTDQRDEIFEELRRRITAIKNGTIKTYLANQQRKRMKKVS